MKSTTTVVAFPELATRTISIRSEPPALERVIINPVAASPFVSGVIVRVTLSPADTETVEEVAAAEIP